jgi:hypothetical protein
MNMARAAVIIRFIVIPHLSYWFAYVRSLVSPPGGPAGVGSLSIRVRYANRFLTSFVLPIWSYSLAGTLLRVAL